MKKIILAALLVVSLLTAAPAAALADYGDISGQWYTDAAQKYAFPEIFQDGGGKFHPERKITRIEFVRLLHKALDISINYFAEPDIGSDFSDMKNTDAGAQALIDLVSAGIVEKGGSFNPGGQLDREIMIHWIINALNYKTGGDYPTIMIIPAPFDDDKDISSEYKNDVVTGVILKLVRGYPGNILLPKQGATRAEAVTAVSRLTGLLDSYKAAVDIKASAVASSGGLTMSLTIQNNTSGPVTISHTSGMKYDFKLFDAAGNNLYTWSADKVFLAALGTTVIEPGRSVVFSDTLDAEAYKAISDKAVSMTAYIVGASEDFPIDADGYSAEIIKS